MKYLFGFIGCGNMGGALLGAALKTTDKSNISVYDKNEEKTRAACEKYGVTPESAENIILECKYVFLGVKPQVLDPVMQSLGEALLKRENDLVLVSMAAGISSSKVRELSLKNHSVIRIMPNTPVAVGEGVVWYCPNGVKEEDEKEFCRAMSGSGVVERIDESKIDAASALSGCGPAFVYMFAKALAEAGRDCGLEYESSLISAAQTVKGAAEMLLKTKTPPDELTDAVCSPGGSTIEGVKSLRKNNLSAIVADAVNASYLRTLEMGK